MFSLQNEHLSPRVYIAEIPFHKLPGSCFPDGYYVDDEARGCWQDRKASPRTFEGSCWVNNDSRIYLCSYVFHWTNMIYLWAVLPAEPKTPPSEHTSGDLAQRVLYRCDIFSLYGVILSKNFLNRFSHLGSLLFRGTLVQTGFWLGRPKGYVDRIIQQYTRARRQAIQSVQRRTVPKGCSWIAARHCLFFFPQPLVWFEKIKTSGQKSRRLRVPLSSFTMLKI